MTASTIDNPAPAEATAPAKSPASKKPRPRKLPPYHVILLDDDDHTYDYVIDMLRKLFGHTLEQAFLLAHQVDTTGKVILDTTSKERAELKRDQVASFGRDWRVPRCEGSMTAVVVAAE